MQVNAEMSTMMTERFNVSGALLAKLFGRPGGGGRLLHRQGRPRPRHGREDRRCRPRVLHRAHPRRLPRTALVYGVGGDLAIDGALTVGTLVALAACSAASTGPSTALSNVRVDVMTALVSFERVFEVLDLDRR